MLLYFEKLVVMIKRDGFEGQRSVILPDIVVKELAKNPISSNLYITDIGFYPRAANHLRKRPKGCSQFILLYSVDGEGWISLGSKRMKVQADQYFIIPKDTAHSYGSSSGNPWSIYWIHFSGSLAIDFIETEQEVKSISPSKISRVDDRLQLFEEMLLNLEMGYSIENINYANICLLHFLASLKYLSQFRQVRKIAEDDLVERSIMYMRKNINRVLTLEELAIQATVSVSHYSLVFRKKAGRSPFDYFIQLKIQHACRLLDHTAMQVKEVAIQIGYDDQYYFSRIFKKVMNQSPKEYRKNLKG